MKKIIISLIWTLALYAADDQVNIAQLTVEQKQKIIFDQLQDPTRLQAIVQALSVLDVTAKKIRLEELRKLLLPGHQEYEVGRKCSKEGMDVVQRHSSAKTVIEEHAKTQSRHWLRLVRAFLPKELLTWQLSETIRGIDNKRTEPVVVDTVRRVLYAHQLQRQLNIPYVQEQTFNNWYQYKWLQNFESIQKAALQNEPIMSDHIPIIAEFPPEPITDQDMQGFVDLYQEASKRLLQDALAKEWVQGIYSGLEDSRTCSCLIQ